MITSIGYKNGVNVSSHENIRTIEYACMLLLGALYLFNHVYVQYVKINIYFKHLFAISYLIFDTGMIFELISMSCLWF